MRLVGLMLTCLLVLLPVAGPGRTPQSAHAQMGSIDWEQKFCSACGREVPLSSHAGQHCPHCGAYWSFETTSTRQTEAATPRTVAIVCGDRQWDSDYREVAGRLMVPVRTFEEIGAMVEWDTHRGITVALDRVTVSLQAGKTTLTVSTSAEEATTVSQPAVQFRDCRPSPRLVGGTTYVPLRAVAEALGYVVAWDGQRVVLSR